MEYHGKLYGKIGNKYFDTEKNTNDYDKMLQALKDCKTQFEAMENLELQNNAPNWLIDDIKKLLIRNK